ncbi:MAG: hypothetical protein EOP48_16715 [Sphingobacteriales bacterium]|nr:MAG: hypothetical protein EOP48_16715 [Sphingobacteriales bacterium]
MKVIIIPLYAMLLFTSCKNRNKDVPSNQSNTSSTVRKEMEGLEVFAGLKLGIKVNQFRKQLEANQNFTHQGKLATYRFSTKNNNGFVCRPHEKHNADFVVTAVDFYMCQSKDDIVRFGIDEDLTPQDIRYNLLGQSLYGDASEQEIFDYLLQHLKQKYTPVELETKFLANDVVWNNCVFQPNENYKIVLNWISIRRQPMSLGRIKLTYQLTKTYLAEHRIKPRGEDINDL